MKIHLKTLKVVCRKSEELIPFSDNITFFHGQLSAGKSSIARLVDFCFGGDLEQTTAINREFVSAHLSLFIGEHDVLIERAKGEGSARVNWTDGTGENTSVIVRAKGDGPAVYDDNVVNISDLIFRLLGLPIMKVRKRTFDEDSPMIRLSFRDIFKFCYLEQEELDSSFFRLNTPVLAEKSKDCLNFFTGYFSERLSELEAKFEELRHDQRSKREAAEKIREFLAQFGYASDEKISGEIASNRDEIARIEEWLTGDRDSYRKETHFADDQRDALRALSDKLEREKEALGDIDERLESQRELKDELISMKFKTARAERAKSVLRGTKFEHCPNCGQSVDQHRASAQGDCYLCLQPTPEQPDVSLASNAIASDLEARLNDIQASIRRHEGARKNQQQRISELEERKQGLDKELEDLLSNYETNRYARVRSREQRLAALRERDKFLKRVRAMPGAVTKMIDEAEALTKEIRDTQKSIDEERKRLSFADENFALLEKNFLEALLAVKVPGVDPGDRATINRRTLIPEIHPGGDRSSAYNFYNAGSGGKKTLITICFALALHRTAAQRDLPLPTILIIDTPLKNITPDINRALVAAFYEYLYGVAENDLTSHQVVIIDQLLVRPKPSSELEFIEREMVAGDPEHPPLISYYNGP